ncbi:reverse transcriptase domain-containing protein [Tanacetum coccineum]
MQKEKEQQDKLNAVKARLLYGNETVKNQRNHEESHYSESKTPTARTEPKRRHENRRSRSPTPVASVFKKLKQNRPPSPRPRPRKECGVFNRGTSSWETSRYSESEDSEGGHWKSKSRRHRSNTHEDDLSQPWTCEERNPFIPRIRHFNFPRTRMPSHVKTYDGSRDPEDHLKLFQAVAKTERWAMPTWCHMFNSTLTRNARVWFDKLLRESIDNYEDLRTAFRENYLQQTKHIKDPVEIHHIKQRDKESTENFMERYKAEILDVEGAPECMKISGFMHGITHPELIKRLYEKILRSMDEMYRVTTSFLQGKVAAFSHSRKKAPAPWKQPEGGNKTKFIKGFKNKQRSDRKPDRFSLLTKTLKEIFALEKGKFKAPPPMHGRMHAAEETDRRDDQVRQIVIIHQRIKAERQAKGTKEGETAEKDKPLAILMIQQWERVAKQMVIYSFFPETTISFSSLGEEDGTEGPMIIKAEIGGHFVHQIYVDGATTSLIGFSGETIWPIGQISLLVKIGDEDHSTSAWMNFMVIRSPSQHNGIIGRTGIRKIRAVPSTTHRMLKFPVKGGTVTLRSSRAIPMECAMTSQVLEEKIKVVIHPEYAKQIIAIGSTLTEKERKELCALLKQNLYIFTWKPADITGVPRHMAEHRLNVREGCLPVRQKKKGQAPERNKAIQEEVEKLVDVGIMKEVHYHSWLSNPVMVKKHDGSWRMCVDFKDLNKACPRDGYPLPEIDWKVESLCEYPFKCFLDANKGYHQIKMAEEDEEKTAFITSQGIFCYKNMSFGLKNVGATYQRLVDSAFQKQIGRNLEVYIDDLVIKIHTEEEIIRDIAETFKTLWQINMKLNPKKCTFGMQEVMFLGYKVNAEGLKVCPDKADAVLSLPSLGCLKDVHKLNRKLASLNRFLSKSAKKSLPFFKTLKKCTKKSDFQWTQEAEVAFKHIKKLIAELPMLTAPKEKEELIIYLAAAKEAISAVLMTERGGKQFLVYFVSRALRELEVNYTPMEKLVLALLSANFIIERLDEEFLDKLMAEPEELLEPWTLFTDGSSCIDRSGVGLILTNLEGVEFTYAMRFRFEATNNEAEYEALIASLRIAEQIGVKNLQANVDSRLVANQVNGSYVAKESGMVQYLKKVKTLASNFKEFSIKQVPQSENKKADALSKIASTSFAHLSKQVLVEELKEKSIHEREVLAIVEEEEQTWMPPIYEYLTKEILPEDKKESQGGSCNMHSGPRSVVAKAIQTGYYWPTMHTDARKLIRECNDCQVHRPILRNLQQNLTPITSPWPFYNWGIDIAGPFSEGPGKVKFLILAIDYFTKWIEAKPVATITGNQVKKFIWDNIVCWFGLPGEIVSDNGKQFGDNPFKD